MRREARLPGALLAWLLAAGSVGCSAGDGAAPDDDVPTGPQPVRLTTVADGLTRPAHVTHAPGDADRLFVVEQPGRVRIIRDGSLLPTPFLDITGDVRSSGNEQGLLSIAFHPDYAANGRFYVNYTDSNGDTRVERYTVSGDPDLADPQSASLVLSVAQPYSNHNGGYLLFGPDGMLWIGMGDGGSGGDPQGHGQDTGTLLGALLRIDVDAGEPYAIPPDNPFVGVAGARPEIWAYGLRNPWRYAIDDGVLYVADVGQNRWEEVHVEPADRAGINYGWNIMEGAHCFNASSCDRTGLAIPPVEFSHDDGACSVTGGPVYRGQAIASLQGHYVYSDWCAGFLRSFRWQDGQVVEQHQWLDDAGPVTSFGEDAARELYLTTSDGVVLRLEPAG